MTSPPEKIYRCCSGIHMNGSEDIAWVTTPNHYIEAAYPHTHIEYLRPDIHEKELREMASFIIGAMNYGRIWNPDEALTAFLKSKEKP
jgi:hypothetical protein